MFDDVFPKHAKYVAVPASVLQRKDRQEQVYLLRKLGLATRGDYRRPKETNSKNANER